MAMEILAVPDEHLAEFVGFLRTALDAAVEPISQELQDGLTGWCDNMDED